MTALECTQKLIKAFGKSAEKLFPSTNVDIEEASILGCWSAHLVVLSRVRYVIFINNKTLLTIFIPFKPKETLIQRFQQALFKELLRLGVAIDAATEESLKFLNFTLEKNTNRSITGYINEMVFAYKVLLSSVFVLNAVFSTTDIQKNNRKPNTIKRLEVFRKIQVAKLTCQCKLSGEEFLTLKMHRHWLTKLLMSKEHILSLMIVSGNFLLLKSLYSQEVSQFHSTATLFYS